jgi:hypothetical protein
MILALRSSDVTDRAFLALSHGVGRDPHVRPPVRTVRGSLARPAFVMLGAASP